MLAPAILSFWAFDMSVFRTLFDTDGTLTFQIPVENLSDDFCLFIIDCKHSIFVFIIIITWPVKHAGGTIFCALFQADADILTPLLILRLRDMRKQAEVDSVVKDEQMRLIQDLQNSLYVLHFVAKKGQPQASFLVVFSVCVALRC